MALLLAVAVVAPQPLGLAEALQLAYRRNPDLAAVAVDARISELETAQAAHRYGFVFEAGPAIARSNRPTSQTFLTGGVSTLDEWTQDYRLALRQTLLSGGRWGVEVGNQTVATNSQRVDFNPSFRPEVALRLDQPLWRNLFAGANAVDVAKLDAASAQLRLLDRRGQLALDVETAYWDWVAAREEIRVREASLGGVRAVLASSRAKAKAGLIAPADTIQPEAAVAIREADVLEAARNAAIAEDRLRGLIGPAEDGRSVADGGGAGLGVALAPADRPAYKPVALAAEAAWLQADGGRPDLRLARLDVERQALLFRQAELLGKPQLDLTARASTTNLGADFGAAVAQLPGFRYLDLQAGMVLSVPLGPNALEDEVSKAKLRQERAAAVRAAAEHAARVAVRLALRDLGLAAKRFEATRLARGLAERSLAAERKKLAAGMSTAFQVLVFQGDADAAALSENRAVIQHLQARARLTRALGVQR